MKKKLFALLTALTLTMTMVIPGLAMETATPMGESWRVDEENFKEQYMADYTTQHREEYEAFDADAYAQETGWVNDSMEKEEFRLEMWRESRKLRDQEEDAFNAYIVEEYEKVYPGEIEEKGLDWALMVFGWESVEKMAAESETHPGDVEAARRTLAAAYVGTRRGAAYSHERALEYQAQYPGSYESYDPDKGYEGYWAHQKQITIDRHGLQNEVEWKEYMYVVSYMPDGYIREREEAAKREEYPQRWPEEYAAFDPYAWFAGYYHDISTPETYMEQEGLDAEGFKVAMFLEWVDKSPTSFFNGYCVTVDSVPVRFQFYRDLDGEVTGPKVENERILIPLRPAAEALGLTVEWKPETGQVICSNGETAVTFTLGSREYSGGTLEAAPFAEKGITYLPLRALGETLGCGVEWKQDFATAALTTGK